MLTRSRSGALSKKDYVAEANPVKQDEVVAATQTTKPRKKRSAPPSLNKDKKKTKKDETVKDEEEEVDTTLTNEAPKKSAEEEAAAAEPQADEQNQVHEKEEEKEEEEEDPPIAPQCGRGNGYAEVIFNESHVPDGYEHLRSGDRMMTVNCKKLCEEKGYIYYEFKERTYKKYYSTTGIYIPAHIKQLARDVCQGKREKRDNREQNKVFKVFREMYPSIPEDIRLKVFNESFRPNSHRVGRATNLDMRTKVKFATEAYVLHHMTNFDSEYERRKSDIYDDTVGEARTSGMRDMLNYAYEDFHMQKRELMDELKSEYFPNHVFPITRGWQKLKEG